MPEPKPDMPPKTAGKIPKEQMPMFPERQQPIEEKISGFVESAIKIFKDDLDVFARTLEKLDIRKDNDQPSNIITKALIFFIKEKNPIELRNEKNIILMKKILKEKERDYLKKLLRPCAKASLQLRDKKSGEKASTGDKVKKEKVYFDGKLAASGERRDDDPDEKFK